jgi:hypothetical protein
LLSLAGVVVVVVGGMAMAPGAGAAPGGENIRVPCSGDGGGPAGIAAAVNTLNGSGGGGVVLAIHCTYAFTDPFAGANAVAPVKTHISVIGDQATLTRNSSAWFRFFEVASGGKLELLHMSMKGGRQFTGGALLIDQGGTAEVQSDQIENNDAQPSGGGIYDEGTLRMEGTILNHNFAEPSRDRKSDSVAFGAGLRITASGNAQISSSEVTDNVLVPSPARPVLGGAGIFNDGQLTVTVSRIKGNSINTGERDAGSAAGAGIGNRGTLALNRSRVDDNTTTMPAGGTSTGTGVWNAGTFTSTDSTITGNIAKSVHNTADGAGVYSAIGKMDLVDTHITKNTTIGVHTRGAGVALSDTEHTDITVKNSPITENVPDNCFPANEVPTCVNPAGRGRSKG